MNETLPSQDETWIEEGRKLFAGPCTFVGAATRLENLPPATLSEVAFAGRSNVGKSSLINALVNQKKLARVSDTPGRTQEVNFFSLGGAGLLVDLPGYGYAQVSKEKRVAWGAFIIAFLKCRSTLKRVYVLIDSRHGIKETDKTLFDVLDKAAVSYQIVLTKSDKLTQEQRQDRVSSVKEDTTKFIALHPELLLTSSLNKEGIEGLRAEVAALFLDSL